MPEFLQLVSPDRALRVLLDAMPDLPLGSEIIQTSAALGRVSAASVVAPHPLPEFPRSTMDGFAVRARETQGASESQPGYLKCVGEVAMGSAPSIILPAGGCTLIHTGGMLPEGADAVIMLEHTQRVNSGDQDERAPEIEVTRPVAVGENVLPAGGELAAGQGVVREGVRLRPAETGVCMALGITELCVTIKPKIGLLASGDEVIAPQLRPSLGQVRDVNSYTLAGLVEQAGGEPLLLGIVPDRLEALQVSAREALEHCDVLVITAGSSASARDLTARAIDSLGSPGVLVHGVQIRPGKPTILALAGPKPILGLPGNPVSAFVVARVFLLPVIDKLLGLRVRRPKPVIQAILSGNIPSRAGTEEWVPVRLTWQPRPSADPRNQASSWVAEPIFGRSNQVSILAEADGWVTLPEELTGLGAGEVVDVYLL
jgi:molybdopterin molybdotransferase